MKVETKKIIKNKLYKINPRSGISLIVLVITIVVVIILATSVIVSLQNNNPITEANKAKYMSELSNLKEQYELYIMKKTLENTDFKRESLNAGANNLTYNTQLEEEKGNTNIDTIFTNRKKNKLYEIEIIKGELMVSSQDKKILELAKELEMNLNPYLIDENGALLSSDTNLFLVDESSGVLIIPETIKGKTVEVISEGAFGMLEGNIKKIVIPSTVREIKANAFKGNSSLEEVEIQTKEGQGLKIIGDNAFRDCINLKEISLPDTVVTVGSRCFGGCKSLNKVKLSNNMKNISVSMFSSCYSLEDIEIPNGVEEINWGAFSYSNLKRISLPKTLKIVGAASFASLKELIITIDPQNTYFTKDNGIFLDNLGNIIYIEESAIKNGILELPSGVKVLQRHCAKYYNDIKKVVIPSTVTQIYSDFFPIGIKEIEIDSENQKFISNNGMITSKDGKILYMYFKNESKIDLKKLDIIEISGLAFTTCSQATELLLPEKLEKLGNQTFNGMTKITSIHLGKNLITMHKEAFCYNNGIKEVTIDENNPNYMAENGAIYNKNKTKLISLVNVEAENFIVPDSVTEIGESAFLEKRNLKNVTIPSSVKSIGINAFSGCTSLNNVILPSSIEIVGSNVFENCTSLKSIVINKKQGSISGTPWGCPIRRKSG